MILIFDKKTIFSWLVAVIFKGINCKVLITSPSESYLITLLKRMGFKSKIKSLIYLDMCMHNIKDTGLADGDFDKISNRCVENLYEKIEIPKNIKKFFPNIRNLEKKLKLSVYQHFDFLFLKQQSIIIWIKSSDYKYKYVINFSSLRPGAKCVWRSSKLRVFFIFNYFNFVLNMVSKLLISFVRYFLKFIFLKFKKIVKNANINNQSSNDIDYKNQDVLFFPHNGVISYGNPPKDHFYSDQINSPFHPSKIIHLEYDKRLNIKKEKEKMMKYFNVTSICYNQFFKNNFAWSKLIIFFIKNFLNINFFLSKNFKSNFLFYIIIFHVYISYTRSLDSLEDYKKAKLALVGYEILFPKAIALALENLNIKTIAITDRFLNGYSNNHTLNVNTLLCTSEFSSKIIQNSDRFLVENLFPVGQVRTDHFFDKEFALSNQKTTVIILDFHINDDPAAEKFHPILNWKNDINFRNEILSLVEMHPEINFIFRGKNCDWYKNAFHSKLVAKVENLPNISVDMDFSKNYWKSYHLCASADLIIARPTSLAEECVSKGLNVIVLDYGVNYTKTVSGFLPKLLKEYYCYNFEQLKYMFKNWKKYKYVISKDNKNQIQKEIFSNLTDGKVKDRIQKYLNEIYN